MINVVCRILGTSPYSQSKHYDVPDLDKESAADKERRTWRERMHADANGMVYIPPMALKNCLSESAKFLSLPIKGKGKATYTKHFEAGVACVEPMTLGVKRDDVPGEWLFVPSDGRRGSGSRVSKCFGQIMTWGGDVKFLILDQTITEDVFTTVLTEAGKYIGLGRFRPRNNGWYGRFSVEKISWDV